MYKGDHNIYRFLKSVKLEYIVFKNIFENPHLYSNTSARKKKIFQKTWYRIYLFELK